MLVKRCWTSLSFRIGFRSNKYQVTYFVTKLQFGSLFKIEQCP